MLKSDYPFGARSQVRELLIFRDLERELDGEFGRTRALLEMMLAPMLSNDKNAALDTVKNAAHILQTSLLAAKLTIPNTSEYKEMEAKTDPRLQAAVRECYLLQESGLAAILDAAIKRHAT